MRKDKVIVNDCTESLGKNLYPDFKPDLPSKQMLRPAVNGADIMA